eukprot:360598-Chlamydomonas_euryale.AAC.1
MYAAYALDPMFSLTSGDSMLLPLMSLSEGKREKAQKYMKRFVSESEYDALEEELISVALDRPLHLNKFLWQLLAKREVEDRGQVPGVDRRKGLWNLASTPVGDAFSGWPLLNRCAQCLLSMHVSSASTVRNWSLWGQMYTRLTNRMDLETAEKKVFICLRLLLFSRMKTFSNAVDDMELALNILWSVPRCCLAIPILPPVEFVTSARISYTDTGLLYPLYMICQIQKYTGRANPGSYAQNLRLNLRRLQLCQPSLGLKTYALNLKEATGSRDKRLTVPPPRRPPLTNLLR